MEIFFYGLSNPFRVLFLPLNFDVNYKFLNYSFIQKRNKTQIKAKTIILQYNFYQLSNQILFFINLFISYSFQKKSKRSETLNNTTTCLPIILQYNFYQLSNQILFFINLFISYSFQKKSKRSETNELYNCFITALLLLYTNITNLLLL